MRIKVPDYYYVAVDTDRLLNVVKIDQVSTTRMKKRQQTYWSTRGDDKTGGSWLLSHIVYMVAKVLSR